MNNVISFLKGKKTYIVVILGALTVIAYTLHYITYDVMMTLLALEGFSGIAALRAAISSLEDKVIPADDKTFIVTTPVVVPPVQ